MIKMTLFHKFKGSLLSAGNRWPPNEDECNKDSSRFSKRMESMRGIGGEEIKDYETKNAVKLCRRHKQLSIQSETEEIIGARW